MITGEATPRCRKVTFQAIQRRGWLEAHHKRLADRIEESLAILAAEQEQWPEKARRG